MLKIQESRDSINKEYGQYYAIDKNEDQFQENINLKEENAKLNIEMENVELKIEDSEED